MELAYWFDDARIKKADKNREIFYALKFTYNKQGKDGSGPFYSLCLPGEKDTLVLYDSTVSPNHLATNICHGRTEGFDFSRIDRRRPFSIPEIERLNNNIVLFEEMSQKEQKLFLETLVEPKL